MLVNQVKSAFHQWYSGLPLYAGLPARGTLAGALVVLERLQESCDLDINAHTAKGGVQIKGTGGPALRNLLARYGETRPFLAEGGRTNMGLRADIKALLNELKKSDLKELSFTERKAVLSELQHFLVAKIQTYPSRQGLKVKYDPWLSAAASVHDWLEAARQHGKEGSVIHHLVGASLQLRFPELAIKVESAGAVDRQANRTSDFRVGDAVFYVTDAPTQLTYDECERDLYKNLHPYLLVPDDVLALARDLAELNQLGRCIDVRGIEGFLADNIAEMSLFSSNRIAHGFLCLLDEYNRRVDVAELDKSLLIEIPAKLQRLRSSALGA